MESTTSFTESDEGKSVVNQNGTIIGRVIEVKGKRAYVNPDPSVTDSIMSKLGWGDQEEDSYLLDTDSVSTITDDEIRLHAL